MRANRNWPKFIEEEMQKTRIAWRVYRFCFFTVGRSVNDLFLIESQLNRELYDEMRKKDQPYRVPVKYLKITHAASGVSRVLTVQELEQGVRFPLYEFVVEMGWPRDSTDNMIGIVVWKLLEKRGECLYLLHLDEFVVS